MSLYLPTWSTDLCRRRLRRRRLADAPSDLPAGPIAAPARTPPATEAAILLAAPVQGREVVARCCPRSAAVGITEGMTLSHARALLPHGDIHVEPHRPERDAASLDALAQWALQFSPVASADPPDGLMLDVGGCQRLFHGEPNLLQLLCDGVRRLGFRARSAIAPTFAAAWALARFAPEAQTGRIVAADEPLRRVLAPLPIESLRLDPADVRALGGVGIRTVAHLLAVTPSDLRRRFGQAVTLRIDQALGQAWETIDAVQPDIPPSVERTFAGPIRNAETVWQVTRELLDRLCDDLARRQDGATRIDVELARSDMPTLVLPLSLSAASHETDHLWAVLRPQIEQAQMGFGVERIRLTATHTRRLPHEQAHCLTGRPAGPSPGLRDRDFGELLDLMVNRLGPDRVLRVEAVASHVPERAFRDRPANASAERPLRLAPANKPQAIGPADRPSCLFMQPERAEVVTINPDGPLLWIRWRGRRRRVAACTGPERIAPEWWRGRPDDGTRDYYKVQDDAGQWLWLFRQMETGQWYIHGQWI